MATDTTKVPFHYIKSNSFRVVHVDGAIGGPTPGGLIFASLYSERAAIPQMMVHDVVEGHVGAERLDERIGKEGVVREIEVGLMIHVETAKLIVKWLQEKVDLVEKLKSAATREVKNEPGPVH
jgi:hypothetical protein